MRDDHGNLDETPAGLFRRVAHAVASVESTWGASPEEIRRIERGFYRLMATKRTAATSGGQMAVV